MMALAPGRLSTMTCCLRFSESFGAIVRHSVSLPPPGGNGEMIRTGLTGYGCCAAAGACHTHQTIAAIPIPVSPTRNTAEGEVGIVSRFCMGLSSSLRADTEPAWRTDASRDSGTILTPL